MKKFLTDERVNEKVSFVINGLTINGLVPTYGTEPCNVNPLQILVPCYVFKIMIE